MYVHSNIKTSGGVGEGHEGGARGSEKVGKSEKSRKKVGKSEKRWKKVVIIQCDAKCDAKCYAKCDAKCDAMQSAMMNCEVL